MRTAAEALEGALLGTAVGDALGLPYEGLPPGRARRLLGPPDRYRFFLGRGMVSDDTEHACFALSALMSSGNNPSLFGRHLARKLRWWLLGLPAGVGFATLRSVLKLWIGFPPDRSGVESAGNGPAMRAPVLGAAIAGREQLQELVRVSTRLTHRSPLAEAGALAIAVAASMSAKGELVDGKVFFDEWTSLSPSGAVEMARWIQKAIDSAEKNEAATEFARSLGLEKGVSGYVLHTVPVALQVWLRHQRDYRSGVVEAISLGGDTDTVAAIVGGLIGTGCGASNIPAEWLDGLIEWPRTVSWMRSLASAAAADIVSRPARAPGLPVPALLLRNILFLTVVLFHGFRRLFPPY